MNFLFFSSIFLFGTLYLFSLSLVNAAPVHLQTELSPRVSEGSITICDSKIKLRSSSYADICKKENALRPGLVQTQHQYQYEWVTDQQRMVDALNLRINISKPPKNPLRKPATLIQCDHLLEIQHVRYLTESRPLGKKRVCEAIEGNEELKTKFLNIFNGPKNLYNLDSRVNNYKGKYVSHLLATAQDTQNSRKLILPLLPLYPDEQVYPGLSQYYQRTSAAQIAVAEELWNFLDLHSGKQYGKFTALKPNPIDQVNFLNKAYAGFPHNFVKRASTAQFKWFTVNPSLLGPSYRDFSAVGTTSPGRFGAYLQEFSPEVPIEEEEEAEVESITGYEIPPTTLDSSVYVVGGLSREDSAPACVRPRDSNDEAALSCTLGGVSSPSNHSGILPLSSNTNSNLPGSSLLEGSLDSSPINRLPTSTLLDIEAAQTPVNTFNQFNTLEPVNTLNRAQIFDSRPTSPTMNGILPPNSPLKSTLPSTSQLATIVNTPIYRQSLNNGFNQNQFHSKLPASRLPQAAQTPVSSRKYPIISSKAFSTRRLFPATPVKSPFRSIKNSLPFSPTPAVGSTKNTNGFKFFKKDESQSRQ